MGNAPQGRSAEIAKSNGGAFKGTEKTGRYVLFQKNDEERDRRRRKNIDDEMHEIPDGIIDAFVEKIVVRGDGFDWYLRGCGAEDGGCESTNGNMLLREMTFTKEDAKEYLYAIDNRRRIHRWVDINVRIYT